ncbi:MAG: PEGA domain-containing protein [Leptospiraceae bacterium]|nr:PEGA domain-containing protein [Leptospiraceae bacterium]MDW8306748.1 PEGA domain-containing protein [Leptospiraceae bacterium]
MPLLWFLLLTLSLYGAAEIPNGGKVLFPQEINFYLGGELENIPQEKRYLKELITIALKDQLALLRTLPWQPNEPSQIIYPLQERYGEDPFWDFYSLPQKTQQLLPIKLISSEIPNSPKEFRSLLKRKTGLHFYWKLTSQEKRTGELYDFVGRLYRKEELISEERFSFYENEVFEKLTKLGANLRKTLLEDNWGILYVKSNVERASLYLNNIFWGKTPLEIEAIPAGNYRVRLMAEGYEDFEENLEVKAGIKQEFTATLKPQKGEGSLIIQSDPPGAKVYREALYVGITPLLLRDLPFGQYRFRLSQDGFQDEIFYVTLHEKEAHQEIALSLVSRDKAPIALNYYSFFVGSLALSGGFFASWLYFSVKRDELRDEMLTKLSTTNPAYFTSQDWALFDSLSPQIRRYELYATYSLYGVGMSLISALYFFYRYMASLEPKIAYKATYPQETQMAFFVFPQHASLGYSWQF